MEGFAAILQLIYMSVFEMKDSESDSNQEWRNSEIHLGVHFGVCITHETGEADDIMSEAYINDRDKTCTDSDNNKYSSEHIPVILIVNIAKQGNKNDDHLKFVGY
jgi:hypothetical protein